MQLIFNLFCVTSTIIIMEEKMRTNNFLIIPLVQLSFIFLVVTSAIITLV